MNLFKKEMHVYCLIIQQICHYVIHITYWVKCYKNRNLLEKKFQSFLVVNLKGKSLMRETIFMYNTNTMISTISDANMLLFLKGSLDNQFSFLRAVFN